MMRLSETDWDGSTDWQALYDDTDPIKGFPSSPQFGDQAVEPLVVFSYMDLNASYLRAAGAELPATGAPAFGDLGLDLDPVLSTSGSDSFFTIAEPLLAGDFQIGPFTSVAVNSDATRIYVVYHDLVSEPSEGKAQFRVYLVRGDWNAGNEEYDWSEERIAIDADVSHEGADQFMPVVELSAIDEETERVHVAWYDTRNDLQDDGDDVLISLYYAYSDDNGDTFTSIELDDEVISTQHLSNPKFLGDYISITPSLVDERMVIVYMGTSHPRYQDPPPSGPGLTQNNEAIYSWEIEQ
jgi:hypothetical protein